MREGSEGSRFHDHSDSQTMELIKKLQEEERLEQEQRKQREKESESQLRKFLEEEN